MLNLHILLFIHQVCTFHTIKRNLLTLTILVLQNVQFCFRHIAVKWCCQILLVPCNFSRSRGVIPSLAERGEQCHSELLPERKTLPMETRSRQALTVPTTKACLLNLTSHLGVKMKCKTVNPY
jgi:hypothetical protein